MSENQFGQTWRDQKADFWDWMWEKHRGSAMTEALLELASSRDRVIEIGCGAGHIVGEMLKRGFEGAYLGFDISERALERAGEIIHQPGGHDGPSRGVICGDFLLEDQLVVARNFGADLVFARGVLQHQSHWAPMVLAALRCAPMVAMGIGYTSIAPRHGGGWKKAGHYDVVVSLPLLEYEAAAMGVEVDITLMPNPKRPKHQEALVIFRRDLVETLVQA